MVLNLMEYILGVSSHWITRNEREVLLIKLWKSLVDFNYLVVFRQQEIITVAALAGLFWRYGIARVPCEQKPSV